MIDKEARGAVRGKDLRDFFLEIEYLSPDIVDVATLKMILDIESDDEGFMTFESVFKQIDLVYRRKFTDMISLTFDEKPEK